MSCIRPYRPTNGSSVLSWHHQTQLLQHSSHHSFFSSCSSSKGCFRGFRSTLQSQCLRSCSSSSSSVLRPLCGKRVCRVCRSVVVCSGGLRGESPGRHTGLQQTVLPCWCPPLVVLTAVSLALVCWGPPCWGQPSHSSTQQCWDSLGQEHPRCHHWTPGQAHQMLLPPPQPLLLPWLPVPLLL